jgi:hypothetical protein
MRQAGTIRPAGSSRPEPKSPDRSPLPIFLQRHTRYRDGFANLRFLPTYLNSWTLATSRNGSRRPKIRPRKARQLVGRVFLKSRSTSGGRGAEDEQEKGCVKRDRISSCAISRARTRGRGAVRFHRWPAFGTFRDLVGRFCYPSLACFSPGRYEYVSAL